MENVLYQTAVKLALESSTKLQRDIVLEELLCPRLLLRRSEDPSVHVFRFDHEQAVDGNNDVIDLRCAIAS